MRAQRVEHALDHGHPHDGQELLRGRVGEWSQPSAHPSDEDDGLHGYPLDVVVVEADVVVVAAVVGVTLIVCVVVVAVAVADACSSAAIVVVEGLGGVTPFGPK
jgi:hypothetical protein